MSTDLELLEGWRAGDAAAGNELFKRHIGRLYGFFASKVDGPVDDLIQETFLGCVRGRDRFEGRSSFRTYLFSIARRRLYKHYQRGEPVDFTTTSMVALGGSPSSAMAQRRERALLLTALRSIPLEFQVTLELAYWEELKGDEIAEVLDISPHTVRSRMSRGRKLVREQLARLEAGALQIPETDVDFERWIAELGEP